MNTKKIRQRFFEKVNKNGPIHPVLGTRCWMWLAYLNKKKGYGQIKINNKMEYAHRISYKIHTGQIPEGMCVLHKCDNPSCVNPEHLFLGTYADNNWDRDKKGRTQKGETHCNAKLTQRNVNVIRFLHKNNAMTQDELSRKFKICNTTISKIIRRKTWK